MLSANGTLELVRRPRRLRQRSAMRDLVEETHLEPADFIAPLFVMDGIAGERVPVPSLPGVSRLSLSAAAEEARALWSLGIKAIALFPVTPANRKDSSGTEGVKADNLMCRALSTLRSAVPEMVLIADVALDPYTDHGHDGLLDDAGSVANDLTVERLAEMSVLFARAGADWIAPSDMMDGRVGAIRRSLDAVGLTQIAILSYAAKFASAFYGPFRDAVGSKAAAKGTYLDKRGYQLNPANRREAIADALLDIEEGADLLMVKPAGPYLDILRELRDATSLPLVAYQVSGEYAALHAASERGWLDLEAARRESLVGIRRAGADLVVTYFARAMAEALQR